jgi:hypothetical protein
LSTLWSIGWQESLTLYSCKELYDPFGQLSQTPGLDPPQFNLWRPSCPQLWHFSHLVFQFPITFLKNPSEQDSQEPELDLLIPTRCLPEGHGVIFSQVVSQFPISDLKVPGSHLIHSPKLSAPQFDLYCPIGH